VYPADSFGSPEVSVLLRLAEEEPMNMRRFVAGCQSAPARARIALQRLKDMNLVAVEHIHQGAIEVLSIGLTKAGREVAKHLIAANREIEKAKR
jgi:hypothetical protein